jgi:hypothetical protein
MRAGLHKEGSMRLHEINTVVVLNDLTNSLGVVLGC